MAVQASAGAGQQAAPAAEYPARAARGVAVLAGGAVAVAAGVAVLVNADKQTSMSDHDNLRAGLPGGPAGRAVTGPET